VVLLGYLVLLAGCQPGGDSGSPSAPTTPSPQLERQAVDSLLHLYRQALQQEDIDQLEALLQPADALPRAQTRGASQAARQKAGAASWTHRASAPP
jgi:hypothetical protein